MASLALMVAVIFMFVVVSGPLSLLLQRLNLNILAKITAVLAVASGAWWFCVAPFPVSVIGGISALCGCKVISKF